MKYFKAILLKGVFIAPDKRLASELSQYYILLERNPKNKYGSRKRSSPKTKIDF